MSFIVWSRTTLVVFSDQHGVVIFLGTNGLTICYVLLLWHLVTFLFSCFIAIRLQPLHVSLEILSQFSGGVLCPFMLSIQFGALRTFFKISSALMTCMH